jgi:hypothetical protein
VLGLVLTGNPGNVLPPSLDPGLTLRGWDKAAADLEALRKENGATWIAGTNYASAAALAYRMRGVPVVPVAQRVRYAYAPAPDAALLTQPVLIVGETDWLARCFPGATQVGTLARRSGATVIATLPVFRAAGAAAGAFDPGCDRLP